LSDLTTASENPQALRDVILNLPTDVAMMSVVDAVVTHIAQDMGFESDVVEMISVSIIEGCMNAVKHGNKYDTNKRVHVRVEFDSTTLKVVVKDEGVGFNPQAVADPLSGDNLFRDHGRGLLMIRFYMDEVSYNDDGTELTMVKSVPKE